MLTLPCANPFQLANAGICLCEPFHALANPYSHVQARSHLYHHIHMQACRIVKRQRAQAPAARICRMATVSRFRESQQSESVRLLLNAGRSQDEGNVHFPFFGSLFAGCAAPCGDFHSAACLPTHRTVHKCGGIHARKSAVSRTGYSANTG